MDHAPLRSGLIRLAAENPELRPALLPLLREAAAPVPEELLRGLDDAIKASVQLEDFVNSLRIRDRAALDLADSEYRAIADAVFLTGAKLRRQRYMLKSQ